MNLILLKPPNREELLDHVDTLIEKIKEYNSTSRYKVSKAVLSGEILTSSKKGNFLSLQFKDSDTEEIFPFPLLLQHNLTQEDKEKYKKIESESIALKFEPLEQLLISNYVKVQTMIDLEIDSPTGENQAKIVFNDKMIGQPALKYSLSIKKDFFNDKKLNSAMTNIRQKLFKQAGIKIASGINSIENHLNLPLTITEKITLDDFVEKYTTENYQK